MGGIGLLKFLGSGTPSAIVRVIAARLPSPQSHFPFVRSGASGVPLAFEPWQPAHVPLSACPWKMRAPRAISASVAPGGTGSEATADCEPALGLMPSGGNTLAFVLVPTRGVEAGARPVV